MPKLKEYSWEIVDRFIKKLYFQKVTNSSLCKYRYKFISKYSEYLIRKLKLDSLLNINLGENIKYKIASYNVHLDLLLVAQAILPAPKILRNHLLKKCFSKLIPRNDYEININWDRIEKEEPKQIDKVSNVYFATMNNYLNSLIPSILDNESSLLILPYEAKSWINYKEVLNKKIPHIFLEDILTINKKNIDKLKTKIINIYESNKDEILLYNGVDLSPVEKLLRKFLFNFMPLHIYLVRELEKFLRKIASGDTHFYVARDRRALENAFIQIGNNISGKTHMLIHGMISKNTCYYLWSVGRFEHVKYVHVWGKHDKDAITQRQKFLNEQCPNILVDKTTIPFRKVNLADDRKYVLFAAQPFTNAYIKYFSEEYPRLRVDYPMIIRLHPEDKDKIIYYKRYSNKNVLIDDLKRPIYSLLKNTTLVITFTSTVALEAMYNGIPTLFLNFKKLKTIPHIYMELPNDLLTPIEINTIFLDENNWKWVIKRTLEDCEYKHKIITINKKILSYFVEQEY